MGGEEQAGDATCARAAAQLPLAFRTLRFCVLPLHFFPVLRPSAVRFLVDYAINP